MDITLETTRYRILLAQTLLITRYGDGFNKTNEGLLSVPNITKEKIYDREIPPRKAGFIRQAFINNKPKNQLLTESLT